MKAAEITRAVSATQKVCSGDHSVHLPNNRKDNPPDFPRLFNNFDFRHFFVIFGGLNPEWNKIYRSGIR